MEQEGPKLRIVLVDDDHEFRHLTGLLLDGDGRFEVVGEASDGWSGLEVAHRTAAGAVITDMRMPGLGGERVVPLLRTEAPGVFVVVLSSEPPAAVRRAVSPDAIVAKGGDGWIGELTDALAELADRAAVKAWPAFERRSRPRIRNADPGNGGKPHYGNTAPR